MPSSEGVTFSELVTDYYFGNKWEMVDIRSEEPYFFHLKYNYDYDNNYINTINETSKQLHLIVVRGTWTFEDAMQDFSLWCEINGIITNNVKCISNIRCNSSYICSRYN